LTAAASLEIVAAVTSDLTPFAERARWAVIALVAVIATDVLAIGSDWLEIDLMNRVLDGADVSFDDLDANDTRQGVAGLLSFGAFIAAVSCSCGGSTRRIGTSRRSGSPTCASRLGGRSGDGSFRFSTSGARSRSPTTSGPGAARTRRL